MFTSFSTAERAVRYPEDRRMFIGIKPYMLVIFFALLLVTVGVAWLQYLFFGLPPDPSTVIAGITASSPKGIPGWLCLSHWVNFFFLILIIRSGLSILADHPRLYWNNGCAPDSEWIRFTPVKVPDDGVWTAKEDARYLNPIAGLPGYRHSVGLARCAVQQKEGNSYKMPAKPPLMEHCGAFPSTNFTQRNFMNKKIFHPISG